MQKIYFLCVALLSCAYARPDASDALAETREYVSDVKLDGSYNYQYQTSNGIAARETGIGGSFASGSSVHYAPDGQLIQLIYTADENGFQPSGAHLPTPPPIPAAILKALEYIRTHPNEEERQGVVPQQRAATQFVQQKQPQQQSRYRPFKF